MSNSDKIIVLCEDVMHAKLIRRYLERTGFNVRREVRFLKSPMGKTQNNDFVIKQYATQVEAIRSRFHRVNCALVVWIDGDGKSVFSRRQQFDNLLEQVGKEKRGRTEAISIIVPMRNVETWYQYLGGHAVDEQTNYKYELNNSDGAEEAKTFAEMAVQAIPRHGACPSSLIICFDEELPRIRK